LTLYLPDRPIVRFRSVSKAVVADDNDLSVGRAGGGRGKGPTVEVVVKSQHSRSGNSLHRAKCRAQPKSVTQTLRQQDRIFKFLIRKRVMFAVGALGCALFSWTVTLETVTLEAG